MNWKLNFCWKNFETKFWLTKNLGETGENFGKTVLYSKDSLVLKFVGPTKFLTFQMIEDRFNT